MLYPAFINSQVDQLTQLINRFRTDPMDSYEIFGIVIESVPVPLINNKRSNGFTHSGKGGQFSCISAVGDICEKRSDARSFMRRKKT